MRNFKRKTPKTAPDIMKEAGKSVVDGTISARAAAEFYQIPRSTLRDNVKKIQGRATECMEDGLDITLVQSPDKLHNRAVFTHEQERILTDYIIRCSEIYHGLTDVEIRKLAYECAVKFGVPIRPEWERLKMAGPEWSLGFRKRNNLSIRKPQATSIARATAFNRYNVTTFYSKLEGLYQRLNPLSPSRIFCIDETGVTTVHLPPNVIAKTGTKQVGGITSGERGTLVTVTAGVSAAGYALPPLFVIPRVKVDRWMICNAPEGSVVQPSKSGWSTETVFLEWLRHFKVHIQPSPENPVLLILDQHESHVHTSVIDFCKSNVIHLLALPPHCTHRLMPLDQAPFKLLKGEVSKHAATWMKENPGNPLKIYDIPGLVGKAWPVAMSSESIKQGFRVTGIFPFHPDIFKDSDFSSSYVTDRPEHPEEPSSPQLIDPIIGNSAAMVSSGQESASKSVTTIITQPPSEDSTLQNFMRRAGLKEIEVAGDGHCMLYAASVSLRSFGVGEYTSYDVGRRLSSEITENFSFYNQYFSSDSDIQIQLVRYIFEKEYDTEIGDLILAAISNAFSTVIKVIDTRNKDILRVFDVEPARNKAEEGRRIFIILKGKGSNSHYSGVQIAKPENFDPAKVRPLPKAPPRKTKTPKKSRRKRKCAVLTDTPIRDEIAFRESSRKKVPKSSKRKRKGVEVKRKLKLEISESSEDENPFCPLCADDYLGDKPGEKWVKCYKCKSWTHEACANDAICINCDSDDDIA